MKGKESFVVYTAWRSLFELLEDPELVKELLLAMFDLAVGNEVVITNNKVRTAFNAIEPTMKKDLEVNWSYMFRTRYNVIISMSFNSFQEVHHGQTFTYRS